MGLYLQHSSSLKSFSSGSFRAFLNKKEPQEDEIEHVGLYRGLDDWNLVTRLWVYSSKKLNVTRSAEEW